MPETPMSLEVFSIGLRVTTPERNQKGPRIPKLAELETENTRPMDPEEHRLLERFQYERRSRVETFCDILYAIGSGAEKPTHIMYKANLSWNVLDEQIEKLERKGLVVSQKENGKKRYHLSPRGFKVLKQFIVLRQELDLGADEEEG
jgi:predicted transcriptional regulator